MTALEAGADDYVRLPCDLTEIMIRIWALVRRAELQAPSDEVERLFRSGPLSLDPTTQEVSLANQQIPLTATEFRLLHFLMKNRGAVVAHQTLGRALWSGRMDSSKVAQKYVQRLRGKLDDDPRVPHWIASVHGVGYRFYTAVDQRLHVEVAQFVGVDWTAYSSFPSGGKDVADLAVCYRDTRSFLIPPSHWVGLPCSAPCFRPGLLAALPGHSHLF